MEDIRIKLLQQCCKQQVIPLFLVVGFLWWINLILAYSVLIGGLINIISNLGFYVFVFHFQTLRAGRQLFMSFYQGEIGKILLSSIGFVTAFTLVSPLNVLALLCSYLSLAILQSIQLGNNQRVK